MSLQIRSGKNTKFISKLLTIPVLILALVAQPVYVLVASQVASAAAAYSGVIPFTQSEIDANWAKDRSLPSGGYSSVSFAGVSNVLEMKLDKDAANMSGDGFYQTEGLKKQTGSITALKADLYVDGDWIVNNKTVRAGLWGTGKNASNTVSAYPIVEFTTDGYTGWRSYNTVTGAWNNSAAGYNLNAWNTLEITLDSSTDTINYLVNGSTIGTAAANGSTSLAETILNSKNYGSTAQSYDVRWANFSQGTFVPDPVITNVDAYYRVDPTYTAIGVDFKTKNITTATAIELRVNRTNASTYSIHATPSLVAGLNGASDPTSTSGPIVITGSRTSGSWNNQVGTWTGAAAPESVDVIITLAGGETVTLRDTTISENKATWAQVKPVDTTDPAFAITNPVNGSYVRGTQTINAEITDESDIAKVLMNIAGSSRSWTNGSSPTITRTGDIFSTTIDTTTIADGPVHVVLRGTDGAGNTRYWNNNASNRQHVFYVDNTRPAVELVSPVGASYNPVNYEVKATDNLALQTVTAHIYNAANTTLVKNCSNTVTPDGADEYNLVCPVSSLGLANGTYTIRYNAADKAGNIALTKTATFTIDTTKPTIHVKGQGNAYAPTSLGQGNVFREVSFKLFDGGKVDRVEINGVNKNLTDSTWSDVNNIKPGVAGAVEGKNTLVVFDVAGNSTKYEFVLDTTAPKITVKSGYVGDLDDKIFSNVSFKLQDSVMADKYILNGHEVDFTNNKNSDANFQNIKGKLVQGENTIVLYDVAGNSSSYTFTYDATKPAVKLNLNRSGYLVSGGVTNSASVPEIEAFDKYLTRIEVWKDGAKVTGWTTVNQNTTTYKKINWLGNGTYVIRAFDAAGLVSDDFTVTIDNTAPTGTFAYSHSNNLTNQDVTVSLTTSEEVQDIAGWTRTGTNTFTKVFTANGKFTVAFTDIAGNNGGANGEVKRIDKVVPVFLNIADGASVTGSSFVIQVQDPYNNGAHGIYEKLTVDGSPVNLTHVGGFVYEATINGVGGHTVTVRDKANNEATITFSIGDAVPASVVTITNHERNDDGTYTIRGTTTHPTDTVRLWFVTDEGHVEIEGVVVDAEGNWSATTSEALEPGEYALFAVTTNEQGTETPLESHYEFTVTSQNNNNGGGQQGGAEVPVPEDDDEDESADQDGFIAFLPATFGGLGLNDGAATTPLPATPTTETDDDTDILGAQDIRTSWSAVNAALAGFIAILALVALAGIRRKETDNNTGARLFMIVPAAAAVIAFFVIEDIGGSMGWFNVWTWLFAGILVVQAILATLTTRTAND